MVWYTIGQNHIAKQTKYLVRTIGANTYAVQRQIACSDARNENGMLLVIFIYSNNKAIELCKNLCDYSFFFTLLRSFEFFYHLRCDEV